MSVKRKITCVFEHQLKWFPFRPQMLSVLPFKVKLQRSFHLHMLMSNITVVYFLILTKVYIRPLIIRYQFIALVKLMESIIHGLVLTVVLTRLLPFVSCWHILFHY